MAKEKQPWMKLYTTDILADTDLKSCSMAAKGMYLCLLPLMHGSVRRGYLIRANGQPYSFEQLSRVAGCSADEAAHLVQELITAGVFESKTDDGGNIIYSPRMARESEISEARSLAGKKGADSTNGKAVSVLPQQNDRQTVLPQQNDRQTVLPQQNDRQNPGTTDPPVLTNELSPGWLAERWLFAKAGHKGRDSIHAVVSTFRDMILRGCSPEAISDGIDAPGRPLTEPIWDFEQRVYPKSVIKRQADDARIQKELEGLNIFDDSPSR